jgi:surface polysaccharide O-acyltransferase-like enzyme
MLCAKNHKESKTMKHIEYIDAFRGLCVFIVVYTHMIYFGMNGYDYMSGIHTLLTSFFLVGFFFVSGYVGYKEQIWGIHDVGRYVWEKLLNIFIPTLITGTLFMVNQGDTFLTMAFHEAKMGFWFTWALFVMMVVYSLIMMIVSRINNDWLAVSVIVLFASICIALNHMVQTTSRLAIVLELKHIFYYMPYFLLGVICKKHEDFFQKRIVSNPFAIWLAMIMVIGGYFLPIPLILRNISITLLIFAVIKGLYETNSRLIIATPSSYIIKLPLRYLSYIGKYTIEIYFMHYFLLFTLPGKFVDYIITLSEHGRGVGFVEFIVVGSISVVIVVVAIMLSSVLKQLPFVGKLMFGRN